MHFICSAFAQLDRTSSEPKGLPAGRRHADQNNPGLGAAGLKLQAAEEGS